MTIEKAMLILSLLMEVKARRGEIDQHDAVLLGIEALKFCRHYEEDILQPNETILEGETK